jgi:hypothetical protein
LGTAATDKTRDASQWIRHFKFFPDSKEQSKFVPFSKVFARMPRLLSFHTSLYLALGLKECRSLAKTSKTALRSLSIRVDDESSGILPLLNSFEALEHLALDILCMRDNVLVFPLNKPLVLPTVTSFSVVVRDFLQAPTVYKYIGRSRVSQGCLSAYISTWILNKAVVNCVKAFLTAHPACCKLKIDIDKGLYALFGQELTGIRRIALDHSFPWQLPFVDKKLPEVFEVHVDISSEYYGNLWDLMSDIFEQYDKAESEEDSDSGLDSDLGKAPPGADGKETTQIAGSLLTAGHLEEPTPMDVDTSEATHAMFVQVSGNAHTIKDDDHLDLQSSITDESIREKSAYPVLIRFAASELHKDQDDEDQDVKPVRWLMKGDLDFVDPDEFIGQMLKFAIMLYEHEVYVVDEDWRDYKGVLRGPWHCGCSSAQAIM